VLTVNCSTIELPRNKFSMFNQQSTGWILKT